MAFSLLLSPSSTVLKPLCEAEQGGPHGEVEGRRALWSVHAEGSLLRGQLWVQRVSRQGWESAPVSEGGIPQWETDYVLGEEYVRKYV